MRRLPIGTVRQSLVGGTPANRIKVRSDGRPQDRWVPLARLVWEQARGLVPPGRRIIHLDGDTLNDALANLACVTAAGAARHFMRTNEARAQRTLVAAHKASAERHAANRALKQFRPADDTRPVTPHPVVAPRNARERGKRNVANFLEQLEAA